MSRRMALAPIGGLDGPLKIITVQFPPSDNDVSTPTHIEDVGSRDPLLVEEREFT